MITGLFIDTFRTSKTTLGFENKSVFPNDEFAFGKLTVYCDVLTYTAEIQPTGEGAIELPERVLLIKALVVTKKGCKYVDSYKMDKDEWTYDYDFNANLDFHLYSDSPIK